MTFDWLGYINIGQPDLREVIRTAYDMSGPQGLGAFAYRAGGLTDEEVDEILARERRGGYVDHAASMDYVNGRSVKMTVRRNPETGDLYLPRDWLDHGRGALAKLLAKFGVAPEAIDEADRAAEEAHAEWKAERAANADIAVAWLAENGGRVANPRARHGQRLDEKVEDGLHAGCDDGRIRYDYDRQEYYLAPAEPA